MSRLVARVALAVAALDCGGLARSRHAAPEGIALPDAGVDLPFAPNAPGADGGLGGRAPVEALCGTDGVVHGSAEVRTQEQADALAGCTRVAGNLSLHHRGVDLSALLSLRVIEGQLWVDGEDAPRKGASREGLDGFRSLEQVGSLTLLRASLTDLSPLARLRRIGLDPLEPREFDAGHPGVFEITECAGFSSLAGLDSLEQVSELSLSRNAELVSLGGMPRLARLDRLLSVRCPLVDLGGVGPAVQELSLTSSALSQLTGLGNASQLRRLTLHRNELLTSLEGGTFPAQMQALSSSDDALVSLKGLEGLNTVEELSLFAPALATLETLTGLTRLGSLNLTNTAVSNLDALSGLRELGILSLSGNSQLSQVDGLSAVSGLGALYVFENGALRTLPRFENVTGTDCENCEGAFQLTIANNPLLESGPSLPALERADRIEVSNNASLSSLGGSSALRSVERLTVQDNPSLVSVEFPQLASAQQIYVRHNPALDDTPLARLRQIPGAATIKIVSNRSGPAELSPCPWPADGECDERSNDCAAGSDVADCRDR